MRILFQGGWKAGRDPQELKEPIEHYCRRFAHHLVQNGHCVILSDIFGCDLLIANQVAELTKSSGMDVKNFVTFMLSARVRDIPPVGRVVRIPESAWWLEERTYWVRQADAVIAIGGGEGTVDCVEKAFLANKPVFVTIPITAPAARVWAARSRDYFYSRPGDAEEFDDLSLDADEFFEKMFNVINIIQTSKYSRRVFVVHGRDHQRRDTLVEILRKLNFIPVVLAEKGNRGLTIIEKLERSTGDVGFAFIIYTPDDLGGLDGEDLRSRARQNVVFEHGLLIGLLGRERTCAVIHAEVELPSDVNGMLFERVTDLKTESLAIARVLKDAGYEVELSGLL